ncbi:hypothetical protein NHX12_013769 [Muraenolepis orangiensis]|uniref:Ig-like domain-containing protein n=1 Tax=Muraenolepis orangiensis TaxID=630683 RepID=A0A9Q0DC62_9TELE|nr:hypothetical protein NHX12_013769 [Muraenolepis orangiensis]
MRGGDGPPEVRQDDGVVSVSPGANVTLRCFLPTNALAMHRSWYRQGPGGPPPTWRCGWATGASRRRAAQRLGRVLLRQRPLQRGGVRRRHLPPRPRRLSPPGLRGDEGTGTAVHRPNRKPFALRDRQPPLHVQESLVIS